MVSHAPSQSYSTLQERAITWGDSGECALMGFGRHSCLHFWSPNDPIDACAPTETPSFHSFLSELSQKLLMRAVYISANLAVVALPERHTASYFAPKIVRFPQNSPGHYCPLTCWLVHLCLFYKSSFMHDCLTVLYIWIFCNLYRNVLCSTLFASGLFESYHFFLFFLLLLSILFVCNLGVLFVRVGFNVIAFSTVIFSHMIGCLPGEWALLTFVFKSLSSEKRIILVNERLEGSDGRRVGGKQQCFSGSYFKEKILHYDWLRVGPRYWIYWIQFKWSFEIKYYCFKKQWYFYKRNIYQVACR